MAIRLNVYCNGQIAANQPYLDNFDLVKWSPGGVQRDALGIPISDDSSEREVEENANISE